MSSGVEKREIKGLKDNVSVTNFICNTYSIRIAIWISRTAIYCDTVLVGDTHPYLTVELAALECLTSAFNFDRIFFILGSNKVLHTWK